MNQLQLRHKLAGSQLRRPLMWWQHQSITRQDIMVASYPRSGNTWLRFLLYELVTGQTADFNTINAASSPCADFPYFQQTPIVEPLQGRLIKTHEPYRPEYGRAIYLVRDPRDVAVSEYHYLHGRGLIEAGMDQFIADFVRGRVNGYGSWHLHTANWLDDTNIELLVVRYEGLKWEGRETLNQIANFLGLSVSVTDLNTILSHNTPSAMRKSEDRVEQTSFRFVNEDARFVRQAQSNLWHEDLTPTQANQITNIMASSMNRLGYA